MHMLQNDTQLQVMQKQVYGGMSLDTWRVLVCVIFFHEIHEIFVLFVYFVEKYNHLICDTIRKTPAFAGMTIIEFPNERAQELQVQTRAEV